MPKKLPVIRKQVGWWFIHFIVFLVVNAILWYVCFHGKIGFVYPWPIWITAAWFLWLVGHACIVWSSYDDRFFNTWKEQTNNG